jgi:glycerol uptake facilitator-like aquaporin
MTNHLKPALAELVGTFILVFIGAGAGALGDKAGGILGVAWAHGLALMIIIYALGAVSGAHVNSAVTFGVAAFVLRFVLPAPASLGATNLANGTSAAQGVVVEAILTVFLVLAVIESGVGKNGNMAGVAIGLVLTMDILMGVNSPALR